MATVVETFYVEETTNLIHDADALQAWNEKCEELQLEGQKTIVSKEKSPIPFLWMNSGLVKTFEVLCPTKVDVTKYDKQPIPVELLETISLCFKEDYFDGIKIWYNEKEKDPVVVGYKMTSDKNYSDTWETNYYSEKYLIGRWADVKASIDSLVDRAKKVFFQSETMRLKQEVKDRQRQLEDLEFQTSLIFGATMPPTNLAF
jgi:hypothetical protein